MAGAKRIIAVDVNADKFEMAKKLGATDCVNPKTLDQPVQKHIAGTMTEWGVDYSFDCTGNGMLLKKSHHCYCYELNLSQIHSHKYFII